VYQKTKLLHIWNYGYILFTKNTKFYIYTQQLAYALYYNSYSIISSINYRHYWQKLQNWHKTKNNFKIYQLWRRRWHRYFQACSQVFTLGDGPQKLRGWSFSPQIKLTTFFLVVALKTTSAPHIWGPQNTPVETTALLYLIKQALYPNKASFFPLKNPPWPSGYTPGWVFSPTVQDTTISMQMSRG